MQDLQNAGSYTVTARVPSPILTATCVNANRTELAPIVYETWPHAIRTNKSIDSTDFWPLRAFNDGSNTNNHTVLDDLFGWRDEQDDATPDSGRPSKQEKSALPLYRLTADTVFLRFPEPGNTVSTQCQAKNAR